MPRFTKRYKQVSETKSEGATYTPRILADFVAQQIVAKADLSSRRERLRILDPAVGDGALLHSLLTALSAVTHAPISVFGFDTNQSAVVSAQQKLSAEFPNADFNLQVRDFLDVSAQYTSSLFSPGIPERFDLLIANPPYVRTQIMGADEAQRLAVAFGLTGRVDLYHAFLVAMAQVLHPCGTAGIIVSNRFLTTRAGAGVRTALRERFALRHIWDLGDTKVFDAAVLPAVILAQGRQTQPATSVGFTTIYETKAHAVGQAQDPMDALTKEGTVSLADGRTFEVRHGTLYANGATDEVWRLASQSADRWLSTVDAHRWATFADIGKIRVGVKTCADKVFIRHDWPQGMELLRALTTHHCSGRYRAVLPKQPKQILYPHTVKDGRRQAADISLHPKDRAYLEANRETLTARTYVVEGGREWYELWVPQDPAAWDAPKLVFRDISERPTFWVDLDGTVVNGDCYWLIASDPSREDLLWLAAAVANSTFIEAFYDHRFNNKLYSGRRRFMTQYVEQFPLPDPTTPLSSMIVKTAKAIYSANHAEEADVLERELDGLVWEAFGLRVEEARG